MTGPTQPSALPTRRLAGLLTRPPRLAATRTTSRHVTWLELFYDLIFVVAVARLAALLHDDPGPAGLAVFAALFVPVWWAWISFSYYNDLFDVGVDDVLNRVTSLASMFGAVVLAVALVDGLAADSHVFAGTYAAMFALLGAMYAYAGRSVPQARDLCRWYVAGSWSGAALWLVSLAVPTPARYVLWGVALLVNAAVSGPVAYWRVADPPRQVSHMPERFGLFVIVVLGEAVLAVVNGTADTEWNPSAVAVAGLAFLTAVAVWEAYFTGFDEQLIDRALTGGRRARGWSFVYGYGHLPLYAAIAASGVGLELAIEHAGDPQLAAGDRLVLAGGLATYLLVLTAVQAAGGRRLPAELLGVRAGGLVVLLLAVVVPLPSLGTTALCTGALVAVVLAELVARTPASAGRAADGAAQGASR